MKASKIFYNIIYSNLCGSILFRTLPPPLLLAIAAFRFKISNRYQVILLKNIVDPGKIALDIGAYSGVMAQFLAKYCKHVYAYEPNIECYKFIVRSCKPNVPPIRKGLSDKSGEMDHFIPKGDNIDFSSHSTLHQYLVPTTAQSIEIHMIPIVSLDKERYNIVWFIKIDTEGHEWNVIMGGQSLIASEKPT